MTSPEAGYDDIQLEARVNALTSGSGYSEFEAEQIVRAQLGLPELEPSPHPKKVDPGIRPGMSGEEISRRYAAADALANPIDPETRSAAASVGAPAVRATLPKPARRW